MSEALVVASNRPSSLLEFVKRWKEVVDFRDVSLIVMHDSEEGEETQKLYKNLVKILDEDTLFEIFDHRIVGNDLKDKAWIIPKKTSACKSYGILKAWEQRAQRIYILDDDCYPGRDRERDWKDYWITAHRIQLGQKVNNSVFFTIDGIRPRGVPYVSPVPVMLSHGLWWNIPDMDAVTQMTAGDDYETAFIYSAVPRGALFPMCGMNVAFNHEIAPLMYFGLQGPEWGVDRFDDIWCGFVAKKIMDHLGMAVSTGIPPINHTRLSDPLINLEKEASGYRMNCEFYEFVMNQDVVGGDVITCMKYMAGRLIAYARHGSKFGKYFEKYGEAMFEWASLFQEG